MSKPWSPMARKLRNMGASVRARLLDRARREVADFQNLLTRSAPPTAGNGRVSYLKEQKTMSRAAASHPLEAHSSNHFASVSRCVSQSEGRSLGRHRPNFARAASRSAAARQRVNLSRRRPLGQSDLDGVGAIAAGGPHTVSVRSDEPRNSPWSRGVSAYADGRQVTIVVQGWWDTGHANAKLLGYGRG